VILVRVTAGRTIRVRLRTGESKRNLEPGQEVKLPEDVAERYIALGLVEGVGDEPKRRGRKPKSEAPESEGEEE
jgi:hypothetical protein